MMHWIEIRKTAQWHSKLVQNACMSIHYISSAVVFRYDFLLIVPSILQSNHIPPSTLIVWPTFPLPERSVLIARKSHSPVMKEAFSDTRKETVSAISSGRPKRLNCVVDLICGLVSTCIFSDRCPLYFQERQNSPLL